MTIKRGDGGCVSVDRCIGYKNPHKDPDPPAGVQDDPIPLYMLDTEFSESFKDTGTKV